MRNLIGQGFLLTPRTRGQITRQVLSTGSWHGRRRGIKLEFSLDNQLDLNGDRVVWRAQIRREWQTGRAGTVFDAVTQIEARLFQKN